MTARPAVAPRIPPIAGGAAPGERVRSLAAMQCVAILFIVARHYAGYLALSYPVAATILGRIDFCEFFFFASGFLTREAARRSGGSGLPLLRRRLLRLYPLHLATTGFFAGAALFGGLKGALNGEDLARCTAASVTLTHAFGVTRALCLNYPSWFLSAVFGMYLAFPLLRRLSDAAGPAGTAAVALAVAVALESAGGHGGARSWTSWTFDLGVLRALPSFLGGIGLAEWARARPGAGGYVPAYAFLAVSLAGMAAGLVPFVSKFLLQGALLLALVRAERSGAPGVFVSARLADRGGAAFPLFLIHAPVAAVLMNVIAIRLVHWSGPARIGALLATALCAIGLALLYDQAARSVARRSARAT